MMYSHLQADLDNIDQVLSLTTEKAIAYLAGLNSAPVSRKVISAVDGQLPVEGTGFEEAMRAFFEQHASHIVAASGPRYWGYVVGGTTPAAIAGDWLAAVFDQNPQGLQNGGDISAMIERQTIGWLLDLFKLPANFTGVFVTGATMSNFSALAIARQWAGKRKNNDIAREGIQTEIKVLTATPHSSAVKSLAMLGLGSNNIIVIKTMEGNREAMDTADLQKKLLQWQDFPMIVISSAGTVNTVDFDDFQEIAALKRTYDFFWHIDAAFGAFASLADRFAPLLAGWERADSITIDCHKWLNVPYDSAVYLIRDEHRKLQLETFQNSNAPYLGDPEADFNFLNAGPENSRRLRALPAWFALQAYGRSGFQSIVENCIAMAGRFAALLEEQTEFILAAPVRLNVVCFTLNDTGKDGNRIKRICSALNQSGKVFITPTSYKGQLCLRAAFVNWRTTEADIHLAVDELNRAVNSIK